MIQLILGIFPKATKAYVHTRIWTLSGHSGFICKSHKLEAIQMSSNRWQNKQTVIHAYNGKLLSNKDEQLITCNYTEG